MCGNCSVRSVLMLLLLLASAGCITSIHIRSSILIYILSSTQQALEIIAKAFIAEAVNDEVDGTVANDEEVADTLVIPESSGTVLVCIGEGSSQDLRYESRCLTNEEDDDDGDEHARDIFFRSRLCVSESCASLLHLLQSHDELSVEIGQHHEREEEHHNEVGAVCVYNIVCPVLCQFRFAQSHLNARRCHPRAYVVFKESR